MNAACRWVAICASQAALLCASLEAEAREIRVPADFATIQEAVDAAADGDVVRVAAGTYAESILWAGKLLALVGEGPEATVIDPSLAPEGGRCLLLKDVPIGGRIEGLGCHNGVADFGGGVLISGGAPAVARCAFVGNTATQQGGAVYAEPDDRAALAIVESVFTRNQTGLDGWGGALFVEGGAVHLARSSFVENIAGLRGGALSVRGGVEPSVTHCSFNGNQAGEMGGAIFAGVTRLSVAWSVLRDNHAGESGGAAVVLEGSLSVSDSQIVENGSGSTGGGLGVTLGEARLERIALRHNEASDYGGGVAVADGALQVISSDFELNVAGSGGGGLASRGDLSSVWVARSLFRDNRAGDDGGGAFVRAGAGLAMTNVAFAGNHAGEAGGGMSVVVASLDGAASIAHATFTANAAVAAGSGLAVRGDGRVRVINSILWGDARDEIAASPGVALSVFYSDVRGGARGLGNIDQDPLFVDVARYYLALRAFSPCLDAATLDPRLVTLPRVDLAGRLRVQGARPDMGAYEAPVRAIR